MMDYQENPCINCKEKSVIYHQYIGDSCCEACGEWQDDLLEEEPH